MTATDLTKLTLAELRNLYYGPTAADVYRRAQANDALRSAAQWVVTAERDMQASMESNDGLVNAKLEQLQERCGDLREALAAASAAPPTPAAPVTDAEIEAAIDDLCEAAYDFEASGCDPEGEAVRVERDKQHALVALIARRVASAGAAPVGSEREKVEPAVEPWIGQFDAEIASFAAHDRGILYALRDGLLSQARRIEALEANSKEACEVDHTKPEEPDWTVTLAAQANVASVRADKARLLTLIVEGLCNLGREVRKAVRK